MKATYFFPMLQAAICVCAAIAYAVQDDDFPRFAYWIAAAVVTVATMFMKTT